MPHSCDQCGEPVVGRSDKKQCSVGCKRQAKREYDKAHHIANRESKIATACEWQRLNRERKQAYDAEYRERTRDKRLELKRIHSRQAWEENPDLMRERGRATNARRRALLAGAGAFEITRKDRLKALARYRGCCAYCGEDLNGRLEWDHVIPISRGGTDGVGNLLPACVDCNRSKAHRFISEWRLRKPVPRQSLTTQ